MSTSLCSNCDFAPATRTWEYKTDAYPMCESCWINLVESEAEKDNCILCEDCNRAPAESAFLRLDGTSLDLCSACYQIADHEPISSWLCEMCCAKGTTNTGEVVHAAHPIRRSDGQRMYVCTSCFETSQNRKAPTHTICEDCGEKFATIVVSRDEKTTVDLCERCYGESLVSTCEDCGCPTTNMIERDDEDLYVCVSCDTRYYRMFQALNDLDAQPAQE